MTQSSSFWRNHRQALATLTPAERKVADWLQSHPEDSLDISIQALAAAAVVSEPTVIRCCRKLGLSGFPALKLQLAQQPPQARRTGESHQIGYGQLSLSAEDSAALIAKKVLHTGIAEIDWLDNPATLASIEKAASVIANGKRVECFGLGGSSIPAQDAAHKLNRLGKVATQFLSLHDYQEDIHRWQSGTVLWIFSRNSAGAIPDIIQAAIAEKRQVVLVGADLNIQNKHLVVIKTPKNTISFDDSPIKPRTMQLLIVDMICAIIYLKLK